MAEFTRQFYKINGVVRHAEDIAGMVGVKVAIVKKMLSGKNIPLGAEFDQWVIRNHGINPDLSNISTPQPKNPFKNNSFNFEGPVEGQWLFNQRYA